jgi:hypothetical protein
MTAFDRVATEIHRISIGKARRLKGQSGVAVEAVRQIRGTSTGPAPGAIIE